MSVRPKPTLPLQQIQIIHLVAMYSLKTIFSISLLAFVSLAFAQSDIESLLDDGYDLYASEKYEAAIAKFNQAELVDSTNSETYLLRGLCQHALGQTRLAVEDLEKAIQYDPEYVEAYQQLGYIYLVSQAPDRAIKAFDKAIELDPTNAEIYVNRGTAKCMNDDKEGAVADWAKAKAMGIGYTEMMVCE